MFELFVLLSSFTWVFWCLVAVEILLLFIFAISERPRSALLSILVSIGVADFVFKAGITAAVLTQPILALAILAVYIVIGVGWSLPKWWLHVRKVKENYLREVQRFLRYHKVEGGKIPKELVEEWKQWGHREIDHSYSFHRKFPPVASENKTRIVTWILYWPFSMLWTLCDEPLKKMAEFIFENIKGSYEAISRRVFSDLDIYGE